MCHIVMKQSADTIFKLFEAANMETISKLHLRFKLWCKFTLFWWVFYALGADNDYYETLLTSCQTTRHHIAPDSKLSNQETIELADMWADGVGDLVYVLPLLCFSLQGSPDVPYRLGQFTGLLPQPHLRNTLPFMLPT